MLPRIVLERYVIIERMAVGGMGEVFLARQEGVGGFRRTVVLKKLLPDVEGNDDAASRLLDEARIAGSLGHENVVAVIEVGTDQGLPVMALEYVHGENAGTLRNRAGKRDQPIPVEVVARIVADAARGLHHAHIAVDDHGRPLKIVHRDVAPKNIFVRVDGVSKIGDFGIASAEQRLAKTATGAVTGTLSYMSPEQLMSKPLTSSSDQWSLGVVLWEMLTGFRLFKADGPAEVIDGILNAKLRSPRRLREGLPRELSDVCKAMLDRDPTRRMPSLEAVAQAIEAAVPGCTGPRGRAAVAAFVEHYAGDDLRERQRRIEEGAEATTRATRPGETGRGLYAGTSRSQGISESLPRAPLTTTGSSGLTGTVPEGLRSAHTGSGMAAPVEGPRSRAPLLAAVATVLLVVGGVGAWVLLSAPPSPAALTMAALTKARPGRALVLREEFIEEGTDHDQARVEAAAETLMRLCNDRLDLNLKHWDKSENDRSRSASELAAREFSLESEAKKALSTFPPEFAAENLDLWAEECWAPIRWLEPASVAEIQHNVRTRVVPQIEDTAEWRQSVVRRLLKRAGVDVESVMTALWPIVTERQALIARYAAVPEGELKALKDKIDERERAGHALLLAKMSPAFDNAIGQIAFIDFDAVGSWVPLYSYLPSVKAKEPGAR
jgi:serine/threonine-protein kinase